MDKSGQLSGMAKQVGYSIRERDGRHQARVRKPKGSEGDPYWCKTFDTEQEAQEWARDRAAEVRLKLRYAGLRVGSAELVLDYCKHLDSRGRTDKHIAEVIRVLGIRDQKAIDRDLPPGWAEMVPDLADPEARRQTDEWFRNLTGAARTRNRKLTLAKGLANWARRERRIRDNPLEGMEEAKEQRTAKPQFTLDELRLMARAHGDPFHLRFCLMLYPGLRLREAHGLHWEHLDLSAGIITVPASLGKGGKERRVPMQGELGWILRGKHQGTGPVFDDRMQRLENAQHGRDLRAFCKRLGFAVEVPGGKRRSPHSLRHCFAGLLTATGESAFLIQEWMAHVSADTTSDYAQMSTLYANQVRAAKWERGTIRLLR